MKVISHARPHFHLRRQKAYLKQLVYRIAPYPKTRNDRLSWLTEHLQEMWTISADRCICEYVPWSPDMEETLVESSPVDFIDLLIAKIHGATVPAIRQLLKRSLSKERDWHGPLVIPKNLAKGFIRRFGLKRMPGKDKDGSIEYEWPSGVETFEFLVDEGGQLLPISLWPTISEPDLSSDRPRKTVA